VGSKKKRPTKTWDFLTVRPGGGIFRFQGRGVKIRGITKDNLKQGNGERTQQRKEGALDKKKKHI